MRRVFGFAAVLLLLTITTVTGQKTKKPVLPEEPEVQQYSYPFYSILNGTTTSLSGCFIKFKDSSYFVTSRHHFYTPLNELRKLTNVMIFVEPNNQRNNAKALSLNMKKQRLMPLCIDSVCSDIILIPINIPAEYSINYVELSKNEDFADKDLYIAGNAQDTSKVVKTRFVKVLERDSSYFLTESANTKDQSGSPVLVYSKNKGVVKVQLAGIYAGRELKPDNFNKGLVSRASFIYKLFEPKPVPVQQTQEVKKKRKKKN
jgi:hypothetical protein